VGIERPVPQGAAAGLLAGVEITNGAVATSGNYRNRYELDGKVVHHTLDARTGRPATALVKSATVIAPDCRTADGWATALMVMGREGLLHIERLPETEAWLLLDGDVVVHTAGAERYVRPFPGVGSGGSGD
jgi:thiamine biosynthesis lipoprotein